MKSYNLMPTDSHKSFYGKAKVYLTEEGTQFLKSYNTIVASIDSAGNISRLWSGWSATTGRHIKAFCGLNKKEFQALPHDITPLEKAQAYEGALFI